VATVIDFIDNVEALDIEPIAALLVEQYQGEITGGVKRQLWDGKKPDGSDITPSYLDDPYFKTRKQAEGYAKWKSGGAFANPNRGLYTPNLYINGYFYSTITVSIGARFEVFSTWGEVGSKYADALGLSEGEANKIIDQFVRPAYEVIVTRQTGLKFS